MPWLEAPVAPLVKAVNSCCVELGFISPVLATLVPSVPSVMQIKPDVPAVQPGAELPVLTVEVVEIASAVLIVVPLSVMLELVGAPPAPPPFTKILVFRMADDDDCVVELK